MDTDINSLAYETAMESYANRVGTILNQPNRRRVSTDQLNRGPQNQVSEGESTRSWSGKREALKNRSMVIPEKKAAPVTRTILRAKALCRGTLGSERHRYVRKCVTR